MTGPAPVIVSVTANNGGAAPVVAGPTRIGEGQWEYVLDAESSAAKLTVVTGSGQTFELKTRPGCG